MGFGPGPKILVSFLLCVFPIVIATATGLKQTPSELVELARSLCASEWQTFRRFRFPSALPEIFIGLKVAISLAVIGAVIGEFVGASEGLGWVIVNSGANVNTALAFAAMFILAVVSVVLFYAIALLEHLARPLGAAPQLVGPGTRQPTHRGGRPMWGMPSRAVWQAAPWIAHRLG